MIHLKENTGPASDVFEDCLFYRTNHLGEPITSFWVTKTTSHIKKRQAVN